MDKRVSNTLVEFEFCDGNKTTMTLAFYLLYKLRTKNKPLYDRYMKIMSKQQTDEVETIVVLYTAYVCAHMDEEIMSEEEFMISCGSDREKVMNAAYALTKPKKQTASE